MSGGRGTRLDAAAEKPLFEVGGRAMVDHVRAALEAAGRIDTTHAAVSPHAPDTAAHLAATPLSLIETPGDGYVADLTAALDAVGTPVLTVAADLPLLAPAVVDTVVAAADGATTSACVPRALKHELGVSTDADADAWVPTGVNVVGGGDTEATHRSFDARLAVNVNHRSDAAVAARLLAATDRRNHPR
ncbi:NTP transferase domain-containing protein [Halobacterium salinarum]|uniref:NTP transferase domain-containing protein n=1 Tax=Halobacterium salinarum TaxID=2242 RepID=UPI00255666F5|nr:NTP transferase domain-containing protein [Halobacterium salinarum]MDL0135173.1 NTP transferase domain-containing protein [Halobacterium salinarum]